MEDNKQENIPEIDEYAIYNGDSFKHVDSDAFLQKASSIRGLDGMSTGFKRKVSREINKYQRGIDAGTKKVEDDTITAYNLFDAVLPPYNLDYLARLYEVSSPHYSAINAKVSNIVGLGYKLVESTKTKRRLEDLEGNQEKTAAVRKRLMRARDALEERLEELNEEDTLTETLVKVWKDYEATGNGYIEIGRKKDGSIGYIGHVPSTTLRVRRKRDGFVQIIGRSAVFFRNYGDQETPNPIGSDTNPNEIIHLKKYSPTSTFYGVPDVVAASTAIAGNEFAARFNLDYFENKAVPRYAIISKGIKLNSSVQAAILSFFETSVRGQNHRSIYIPLPGDTDKNKVELKFEPIEAGIQDSSFNNYKKQNLNEILMAHRVPITKVGVAESVALAVARDADKTFREQVCSPEQKVFNQKFKKVIREFTDAFDFELNEMTLTDADTQSKIDERHVKNKIKTPNEVRATLGLPGTKDGDKMLELKPQDAAEARAQGNRERDSRRSAGATDSAGEGRNPKGEGRTTD